MFERADGRLSNKNWQRQSIKKKEKKRGKKVWGCKRILLMQIWIVCLHVSTLLRYTGSTCSSLQICLIDNYMKAKQAGTHPLQRWKGFLQRAASPSGTWAITSLGRSHYWRRSRGSSEEPQIIILISDWMEERAHGTAAKTFNSTLPPNPQLPLLSYRPRLGTWCFLNAVSTTGIYSERCSFYPCKAKPQPPILLSFTSIWSNPCARTDVYITDIYLFIFTGNICPFPKTDQKI